VSGPRSDPRKLKAAHVGSENVFADLELPDAEELAVKAKIVRKISEIIRGRHLTQQEAAEVLGTTQPIVSLLMRGRLSGFSMERLLQYLVSLDRDVEIVVKRRPRSRDRGEFRVRLA
jgi:predicted XRE-type DNA-binding protein